VLAVGIKRVSPQTKGQGKSQRKGVEKHSPEGERKEVDHGARQKGHTNNLSGEVVPKQRRSCWEEGNGLFWGLINKCEVRRGAWSLRPIVAKQRESLRSNKIRGKKRGTSTGKKRDWRGSDISVN